MIKQSKPGNIFQRGGAPLAVLQPRINLVKSLRKTRNKRIISAINKKQNKANIKKRENVSRKAI